MLVPKADAGLVAKLTFTANNAGLPCRRCSFGQGRGSTCLLPFMGWVRLATLKKHRHQHGLEISQVQEMYKSDTQFPYSALFCTIRYAPGKKDGLQ